jgi:hypothetical protein
MVDVSDDEDEQPTKMAKPSATLRPKSTTFANVADAVNKVIFTLFTLSFYLLCSRPTITLSMQWTPRKVSFPPYFHHDVH